MTSIRSVRIIRVQGCLISPFEFGVLGILLAVYDSVLSSDGGVKCGVMTSPSNGHPYFWRPLAMSERYSINFSAVEVNKHLYNYKNSLKYIYFLVYVVS